MTRDEIFEKVRDLLVEALAVDEDEVTPDARLTVDLGAESIDFLDIKFQLEQTFGFQINEGELFPDNVTQDEKFVHEGRVTPSGLAALKERLPHADFSSLGDNPEVTRVAEIFTVDAVVRFCEAKLARE
ncbi:MAG: acyl carrier protein [Phycisphaerales bacterium]|nr:acyl carrier protein [Phycisphaerales bacterium]